MRSFRFLLSRRWALFAVAVAILVYGTWWLGNWQFGRLHDKRETNGIIRANEHEKPEQVGDVLAVGTEVDKDEEWKRVTATGTYDTAHTIIWRYRSGDHSRNGVDVVVPLVTKDGTALLVDRGWMATADQDRPVTPPATPSGTVTVVGWARADATGDATTITPFGDLLGTRALSSTQAARAIGHPTYGGFVNLDSEDPAPATALEQVELPELNDGPHLFYGIQWWFFGVLAVFGFFYLMYDERRATHKAAVEAKQPDVLAEQAAPGPGPEPTEATPPARAETAPPAPGATDPRAAKKARKAARNAHKQAVRAAYQAAYAKEAERRGTGPSGRSTSASTDTISPDADDAAGESKDPATRRS